MAGLVLAAGGGRRYGGPKALVRRDGELLVERAVATAREAGCAPIVVVLGASAADVRAQAGVVLLGDTPGVTPEAVRRVAAKAGSDALVTATYGNRRGHPVLLGRDHWAGVATLATADVGARAYLTARAAEVVTVACEDCSDDTDLDVPETS